MGAPADVHCYTPAEFDRRRESVPAVRRVVAEGIDLLNPNGAATRPTTDPPRRGYEPPDDAIPI
jgi:hypothetical protein